MIDPERSSKATTTATIRSRLESSCSCLPRGTDSNYLLFPLFILLNFFTYTDRGIIPGASREFSSFSANASDTTLFIIRNPDAGLGILQAGFILGYSVAITICGHLVHSVPWKKMTMLGFAVWICAVFLSALSYSFDSYFVLFVARVLTGVSEASFQVIAPPMFQDRGGERAGFWLSLFLSAMPLGMAAGFVLGSQVANSALGWHWAFWLEGLIALPVLFVGICFVKDEKNGGVFAPHDPTPVNVVEEDGTPATTKLSFWDEIKVCVQSKSLVAIIAAQSICIAIFAVLSTFGGAFLLALGIFESETKGATSFATAAAIGGALGTPMGGLVVDRVLAKYKHNNPLDEGDDEETEITEGLRMNKVTKSRIHSLQQLTSLLPVITAIVGAGIVLCYPTLFFNSAGPFIGFFFCGWIFLFMAQSGITMSVMLSVPQSHRSNAIAFTTLMAHACGDVPSPIIFGILKDRLAPACVITAAGGFLDDVQCKQEHFGVRATLGIAYAWITLSLLFFEIARRLAFRELHTLDPEGTMTNNSQEQGSTIRGGERVSDKKEIEMTEMETNDEATDVNVPPASLFPVRKNDMEGIEEFTTEVI